PLVVLALLAVAGCGGTTGDEATAPSTAPATATAAECDEACRFPVFERSDTPLTTADDGNCQAELAAEYGADCTNFQWLGLMGDPSVLYDDGAFTMWFTA